MSKDKREDDVNKIVREETEPLGREQLAGFVKAFRSCKHGRQPPKVFPNCQSRCYIGRLFARHCV